MTELQGAVLDILSTKTDLQSSVALPGHINSVAVVMKGSNGTVDILILTNMELTAIPFQNLVAAVGYITLLCYLLKWSWKCWCGFRIYVQSEFWQADLTVYGQWAGKVSM